MLVTFRVAAEDVPESLYGTGFLVPRHSAPKGGEPWAVTACTFLDRKWPHLAREGEVLLRASLGRIDDTRPDGWTDGEAAQRAWDELGGLLGVSGAPTGGRRGAPSQRVPAVPGAPPPAHGGRGGRGGPPGQPGRGRCGVPRRRHPGLHRQRPGGCPRPLVSRAAARAHRSPLAGRRRPAGPVAPALGLVAARAGRCGAVLLAPGRPRPAHPDLVRLAGRPGLLRHRTGLGPGLQLVRRAGARADRGAVLRRRRRLHPARPWPGARLRRRLHPGRGGAHDVALRRAPARWRVPRARPTARSSSWPAWAARCS